MSTMQKLIFSFLICIFSLSSQAMQEGLAKQNPAVSDTSLHSSPKSVALIFEVDEKRGFELLLTPRTQEAVKQYLCNETGLVATSAESNSRVRVIIPDKVIRSDSQSLRAVDDLEEQLLPFVCSVPEENPVTQASGSHNTDQGNLLLFVSVIWQKPDQLGKLQTDEVSMLMNLKQLRDLQRLAHRRTK